MVSPICTMLTVLNFFKHSCVKGKISKICLHHSIYRNDESLHFLFLFIVFQHKYWIDCLGCPAFITRQTLSSRSGKIYFGGFAPPAPCRRRAVPSARREDGIAYRSEAVVWQIPVVTQFSGMPKIAHWCRAKNSPIKELPIGIRVIITWKEKSNLIRVWIWNWRSFFTFVKILSTFRDGIVSVLWLFLQNGNTVQVQVIIL